MFEQYDEECRRVIFFARYEASNLASPAIETEHLLLGLMRETRSLVVSTLSISSESLANIRKQIEMRSAAAQGKPKIPTSVDLPMGHGAQIALQHAAEEAAAMQDQQVRATHLLLALLRQDDPVSQILRDFGVVYDTVRKQLAGEIAGQPAAGPLAPSLAPAVSRLRKLMGSAPRSLAPIDPKRAAAPLHEGGWNPKQVLGHPIDSASNNHHGWIRRRMPRPAGERSYNSGRTTTRIFSGSSHRSRKKKSRPFAAAAMTLRSRLEN
jgi:hypothetical protein